MHVTRELSTLFLGVGIQEPEPTSRPAPNTAVIRVAGICEGSSQQRDNLRSSASAPPPGSYVVQCKYIEEHTT